MTILFNILVLLLLLSCAIWAVDLLPLPPPVHVILRIVLGVAVLLWALRAMGVWSEGHTLL